MEPRHSSYFMRIWRVWKHNTNYKGVKSKARRETTWRLDKVIDKFTCSKEHRISSCMQGTYTLCSKIEVDIANDNSQSSNSDVSQDNTSSDEDFTSTVKHYKWATINSKVQKWAVEIDLQDDNEILNKKVNIPKKYIYVHREQYRKYNEIKANLEDNGMLLHVDFAENYPNKQQ